MISLLQALLDALGQVFHLNLRIDKEGACSILFASELIIQLQLDASQEKLFLFSKLIEVPPGKFRENVLREALKTNALADPLPGYLAYLNATNHLVLFQSYPLSILNGDRLAAFFSGFLEMAESWRKAIQEGKSSPAPIGAASTQARPFGMRP